MPKVPVVLKATQNDSWVTIETEEHLSVAIGMLAKETGK